MSFRMSNRPLVYIEARRISDEYGEEEDRRYQERVVVDCRQRGEAPFNPRPLLDAGDRESAWAWREAARKTVVYQDYGTSTEMIDSIAHARDPHFFQKHDIEFRCIGENPTLCSDCGEILVVTEDCRCSVCGLELWR